jgi:hypothetical protein
VAVPAYRWAYDVKDDEPEVARGIGWQEYCSGLRQAGKIVGHTALRTATIKL